MQLVLAAALAVGGSLFAQAEETGGEELRAFADRQMWLGPDEIDETFGNRAFWLAPDEFAETFDERKFALLVFGNLPANPTADDIRAAIAASGAVDKNRILALILGAADPVAAYRAFQAWAAGIGDLGVAKSTHAGDSFAFGVESLFENDPEVKITSASVGSNESGEAEMTVAVTVKDGTQDKPVSSANVAEMFEASTEVADWETPEKQLEPHVTDRTEDVATPVEFTVVPGDGKAPKAFLRIRK